MTSMSSIQKIIGELETLELVTRAFGDIASSRMKNTRDSVLTARDFLAALDDIFTDVRRAYAYEFADLLKKNRKKGKEGVTVLSHNGRSVALLLSSNTGLYGEIVKKTFAAFMEEVEKGESEVTIVGRQGLANFQSSAAGHPYTYFDLPDHAYTQETMSKIIRHIVKYDEIHIYFGKFQNVLLQRPEVETIRSRVDLSLEENSTPPKKFLFEPNLEKLLAFFEMEMFASLFEQVVRESQLAKFASRILAMDKASENIKQERVKLKWEQLAAVHRVANKKQINSLSSVLAVIG